MSSKRQCVRKACNHCRSRKSKCDGIEPTCKSCQRKGLECVYAVSLVEKWGNAETSNQQLREELQSAHDQIKDFQDRSCAPSASAFASSSSSSVSDFASASSSASPHSQETSSAKPSDDMWETAYQIPWSCGASSELTTGPAHSHTLLHAGHDFSATYLLSACTLLNHLIYASDEDSAAALASMRWQRSWDDTAAELLHCNRSTLLKDHPPSSAIESSVDALLQSAFVADLSEFVDLGCTPSSTGSFHWPPSSFPDR